MHLTQGDAVWKNQIELTVREIFKLFMQATQSMIFQFKLMAWNEFFTQRRSFATQTLAGTGQKKTAQKNAKRKKTEIRLELAKMRLGLGFDMRPTAIKRFWVSRTNHSATHA